MKQLLTKCSNAMYGILIYMIVMIALGSMVSKAFFAIFLLPLVLFFIVKLFSGNLSWSQRIPYRIGWWILFAIGSLVMVLFAYSVQMDSLSWDWGKVIRSASERILTGKISDVAYFARYPNNQIWYCFLVVIFYFVKRIAPAAELEQFYLVSIALGCLMVSLTILLFHHIACLLWGEKKAFFAGLVAYCCLPLYMWAPYAYTDTSGMLVLMLLFYIWVKAKQEKRSAFQILYRIVFGILAMIAYKVKVTVFIFVIAAIIAFLLQSKNWRKTIMGLLIIAISMGGAKVVVEAGMAQILAIEEEVYDKNEFPLTHWIMMSMKYGGYVQEDVDYTVSFPTYEKKQQANIEQIKKRLRDRGVVGCAKLFFVDKQIRTWGDASFSGCDYLSREPKNPNGVMQKFVTLDGEWNWLVMIYLFLYYALLLVGMLFGGQVAYKERDKGLLLAARITLLGIAALMTIWECNSRYIVLFLPLMIILSCDGWIKLRKLLRERNERRTKR